MTGEPVRTDQAYVESHESKYITPKDAVAAKAQADVYNVETVLHSAGIPLEQIHAAAELNAKNARLEFEANENADPLRRIIGVLETSAVTDTDKDLMRRNAYDLETQRGNWTKFISQEKTQAKMRGEPFDFSQTVKNAIQFNRNPSGARLEKEGPMVLFDVLHGPMLQSKEGKPENVSDECCDKALRNLGILEENKHRQDLYHLPKGGSGQPGKPKLNAWVDNLAQDLPTNMPGAQFEVFLDSKQIRVGFGIQALEKIVAFPASV